MGGQKVQNSVYVSMYLYSSYFLVNFNLDLESVSDIDKLINLRMPHIGELMFECLDTNDLVQCLKVSQTWKVLAEDVLLKRWKGKMYVACKIGETQLSLLT